MVKKASSKSYKEVDMEMIVPAETNVRLDIPDREIFELSESMKEIGLIHAIILSEKNGKYTIVVGHRRWMAAKKIGWKKIKAEIRELTDKEVAIIRATENLQREGLSPIEEAAIYADLYDINKFTIKMIATKMAKSTDLIIKRMDLLKMDEQVQIAIHKGQIPATVARELHKIDDKKDLYRYLEIAIDSGVSAKVAANWVDEYRRGLQYLNDRQLAPSPTPEIMRPEKSFTMCQLCEGSMEWKDTHNIKACTICFELLMKVVDQGYFKKGGE